MDQFINYFKYFLILSLFGVIFSGCITQESKTSSEVPGVPTQPKIKWVWEKIKDETSVLKSGDIYYYGGTYKSADKTVKYRYTVTSSNPVDIYVVASASDFKLIGTGNEFVNYPSCRGIQVLRYDNECTISDEGGIAILNKNNENAIVTLQVYYYKPIVE
ncbi:MAG: hypothetical protein O8C62_08775 [Candidatus Methanoperedens sp.]|nr:hypothetical protein [Candidatus Methanoperedens sp.]